MNNKQQTAVGFYLDKVFDIIGDAILDKLSIEQINKIHDLSLQAKEMEKEKMIDFAFNFYYDFSKVAGVPFNLISENRINAEDYYDKTYEDPEQAIIHYNKMEEESEMDDYNNLGND
jgi:hypothetical protein